MNTEELVQQMRAAAEAVAVVHWTASSALSCGADALEAANARAEKAERERDEAEKATRVVQNAAKNIASAHGTELEHRRQNATYDHRLRAEHESLKALNSQLTEMHEAANARADAAEAKVREQQEMLYLIGQRPRAALASEAS